jgi:hypothetical protein
MTENPQTRQIDGILENTTKQFTDKFEQGLKTILASDKEDVTEIFEMNVIVFKVTLFFTMVIMSMYFYYINGPVIYIDEKGLPVEYNSDKVVNTGILLMTSCTVFVVILAIAYKNQKIIDKGSNQDQISYIGPFILTFLGTILFCLILTRSRDVSFLRSWDLFNESYLFAFCFVVTFIILILFRDPNYEKKLLTIGFYILIMFSFFFILNYLFEASGFSAASLPRAKQLEIEDYKTVTTERGIIYRYYYIKPYDYKINIEDIEGVIDITGGDNTNIILPVIDTIDKYYIVTSLSGNFNSEQVIRPGSDLIKVDYDSKNKNSDKNIGKCFRCTYIDINTWSVVKEPESMFGNIKEIVTDFFYPNLKNSTFFDKFENSVIFMCKMVFFLSIFVPISIMVLGPIFNVLKGSVISLYRTVTGKTSHKGNNFGDKPFNILPNYNVLSFKDKLDIHGQESTYKVGNSILNKPPLPVRLTATLGLFIFETFLFALFGTLPFIIMMENRDVENTGDKESILKNEEAMHIIWMNVGLMIFCHIVFQVVGFYEYAFSSEEFDKTEAAKRIGFLKQFNILKDELTPKQLQDLNNILLESTPNGKQ